MEDSSESKKLGQRSQSESEGSGEEMRETLPGINISEQIQPLQPIAMHPLWLEVNYGHNGQGLPDVPTTQQQYPRIVEGLMQPVNLVPQRPFGFNIHPNPRIGSCPFQRFDTFPQYQHSQPYQQPFPMGQQHYQTQLQSQYSMMNQTPGYQCPTKRIFPDQSAQGWLTLQPQNYSQSFQYPTMLSNSEGQHGSVKPGTGLNNVKEGEEVPTTYHSVVAISENEKSSSSDNSDLNPPHLSVHLDLECPTEVITIARLLNEGVQLKVLAIECNYLDYKTQTDLLLVIKSCPNIKKLNLKFKSFRAKNYKPRLMSFTNQRFECSRLKNLNTFGFNSDVLEHHTRAPTTSKIGMTFYENMFKEIIKASENLKDLVLCASELAGYLEAMAGSSEITNKFNQLHTLRLRVEVADDNSELKNMNALLNFLPIVSSSLEILHLCRFKSIDLSSYPFMAKLRTIIIESDIEYSSLNISTSSLPQLRNLIFRHDLFAEFLNVEFGWPLNDDVFKPDQVGNGTSEHSIPLSLNIVLYLFWKLLKMDDLDQFFQKIFQARVNALFIDVSAYDYKLQEMEPMIKRILRYVRHTPYIYFSLFWMLQYSFKALFNPYYQYV